MRKPDFFIVGASKCGTTALNHYLEQHPEVFMGPKSPCFFGSDLNFRIPRITAKTYDAYFAKATSEKRVGQACPLYIYSKRAAVEIKDFCPEAGIIIMLRNPVDMIYSYHSELLSILVEDIPSFEAALEAEADRKHGLRIPDSLAPPEILFYREMGRYTGQVKRYFDTFERQNIHVIIYDDFARDTAGAYADTLNFLGVTGRFQPDFKIINPSKVVRIHALQRLVQRPPKAVVAARKLLPSFARQKLRRFLVQMAMRYDPRPAMAPALRRRLKAEFALDVERLSELLGRDLTHWVKDAEGLAQLDQ